MIEDKRLFRTASAWSVIAGVFWLALAAFAVAARARRPRWKYWILKGQKRDSFICAKAGGDRHTALCVFDSKDMAERRLRRLSEPQMFLDALERYGTAMPAWVHQEPLLPKVHEVSGEELWEIIGMTGVEYVALNPPLAGQSVKTLELRCAGTFRAG